MKYYIATSLENIAAAQRLHVVLQAAGHLPTYDWTTHGRVYRDDAEAHQNKTAMERCANVELRGVINADVVIVLLPGGRGTHVELGAALSNRFHFNHPRIFIAGIDAAWPVLSGAQSDDVPSPCAFHYAPDVEQVTSPTESALFHEITERIRFAGPGVKR